MKTLTKEDVLLMEGCNALMAMESARSSLLGAVSRVGHGPKLLLADLDEATGPVSQNT